jgi:hypothetical protein
MNTLKIAEKTVPSTAACWMASELQAIIVKSIIIKIIRYENAGYFLSNRRSFLTRRGCQGFSLCPAERRSACLDSEALRLGR